MALDWAARKVEEKIIAVVDNCGQRAQGTPVVVKINCLNPFVPNALSLLPENIRKRGFLMFSEGRERVHWEQMGLKMKMDDVDGLEETYGITDECWKSWVGRLHCCYLANIYLFKVNNRSTRKRCEICSELTVKTPEPHYCLYC